MKLLMIGLRLSKVIEYAQFLSRVSNRTSAPSATKTCVRLWVGGRVSR